MKFNNSVVLTFLCTALFATASWMAGSYTVRADDSNKATGGPAASAKDGGKEQYVPKTKRELRRILSPIQYDVTQNEATEPAFRNAYWNNKKEGTYKCIVCDRDLFTSDTKYESGTGWPSFYAPVDPKEIGLRTDYRLFYARTEVHCARCNAHLGHVFDDGPKPTGKRYCMNSASLKFVEKSEGSVDGE